MANTFLQIVSDPPAFVPISDLVPERETRKPKPAPPPPVKRRPDDEITGPEIPVTVMYERWRHMGRLLAERDDLSPDRRHLCQLLRDAAEETERKRPKRTKR